VRKEKSYLIPDPELCKSVHQGKVLSPPENFLKMNEMRDDKASQIAWQILKICPSQLFNLLGRRKISISILRNITPLW
jgi:hypothetical protein